jgi:hypothetical protein
MWHTWERREKCTRFLVGKPKGKRPLGRPRRGWENGIRMDLREIGWGGGIGFDWLSIGTGGKLLLMGDEPSGCCAKELVI